MTEGAVGYDGIAEEPGTVAINVDENEALQLFLEYMNEQKAAQGGDSSQADGADDETGDNNIVVLLDDSGNELTGSDLSDDDDAGPVLIDGELSGASDTEEVDSLGGDDVNPSDAGESILGKPFLSAGKPYKRKPQQKRKRSPSEAIKRRGPYRTASWAFKLAVVQYAAEHGRMPASKKFGIKYELIRMWCTQREELMEATAKPRGRQQTRLLSPHPTKKKGKPIIRSAEELEGTTRSKSTHKVYSMAFKVAVIEDYEKSQNQSETARKFHIDRRQIKQWYERRDDIRKRHKENKDHIRLEGNYGMNILSPSLEIRLVSWAQEIAMLGSEFSISMLCDKALEYFQTDENAQREAEASGYKSFTASYSWATKFLQRNNIHVTKNSIREEDIPDELRSYDITG